MVTTAARGILAVVLHLVTSVEGSGGEEEEEDWVVVVEVAITVAPPKKRVG